MDTAAGCPPFTIQLSDSSITSETDSITSYLWNFGDGRISEEQNPTVSYFNSGTFPISLTVVSEQGCLHTTDGNTGIVTAYPFPTSNFSLISNYLIIPNEELVTNDLTSGATSYFWDFGDSTYSNEREPTHRYQDTGTYVVTLVVENEYGCTDTIRDTVETSKDIGFPSAFKPNSDGPTGGAYDPNSLENNIFFPFAPDGIDTYRLMIFNRWGELIFESTDLLIGWDGYYRNKPAQQDTYVWKAYVKFIDGREKYLVGDVTLLR